MAFQQFIILHAKELENLLETPNLVDVKKVSLKSPFHFHAQEEMQIAKIFHFKLSQKFFLHL